MGETRFACPTPAIRALCLLACRLQHAGHIVGSELLKALHLPDNARIFCSACIYIRLFCIRLLHLNMVDTDMLNSSEPNATQADVGEEDLDAAIDQEVDANASLDPDQPVPLGLDGANDTNMENEGEATITAPAFESRISAKKDISLREFLPKMDEYAPIVSLHFMSAPQKQVKSLQRCRYDPKIDHATLRFPTRSQITTSPLRACPHPQLPPPISRASSPLPPKNSLPTSPQMPTNTRASAPQTRQATIRWAVLAQLQVSERWVVHPAQLREAQEAEQEEEKKALKERG